MSRSSTRFPSASLGVTRSALTCAVLASAVLLSACGRPAPEGRVSSRDANCMARAMYFESNRSSRDGMIAVGSVVMNRVASSDFPDTVCGVVSQKNQFAPGVMTKRMVDSGRPLAEASAAAVLGGERHPQVGGARFFHAAWYKANFNNIHYVVTTGGNAFYEKRRPENVTQRRPLPNTEGVTGGGGGSVVLAQASQATQRETRRRTGGLVRGLVSRILN